MTIEKVHILSRCKRDLQLLRTLNVPQPAQSFTEHGLLIFIQAGGGVQFHACHPRSAFDIRRQWIASQFKYGRSEIESRAVLIAGDRIVRRNQHKIIFADDRQQRIITQVLKRITQAEVKVKVWVG